MHVAVLGVRDEVGLCEVEALALALAGFEEWCKRGIDWVVRRLWPVACHERTLPGAPGALCKPGRQRNVDDAVVRGERAGRQAAGAGDAQGGGDVDGGGDPARAVERRREVDVRARGARGAWASCRTPVMPPRVIFRQTASAAPEPGVVRLVHRDRHLGAGAHGSQRLDAVDRLLAQLETDRLERAAGSRARTPASPRRRWRRCGCRPPAPPPHGRPRAAPRRRRRRP